MTMATLSDASGPAGRRRRRAGACIGAVLAASVVYALARLAIADIHEPAVGSAQPKSLTAGVVALVAAIGALLGWAAIALRERVSRRAVAIWTLAAPLVLLASLSRTLSGHGVSPADRTGLMLIHLAAGGVVIPFYRASSLTTKLERQ
jgi:glycerol uptake facilitator-like aquaporin